MEVEIYMPCEPGWVCEGLLYLFVLLAVIGLIGFAFIVFKEYLKIKK